MPIGIQNSSIITTENLTALANVTDPTEFFINVNHTIFGGVLYFTLLTVFVVILYLVANKFRDQPLENGMYAAALGGVVGFFMRAVQNDAGQALLNDHQMWIFPILAILLATYIWATKDR